MTAFFTAYQIEWRCKLLKDRVLCGLLKIPIFSHNFSEAPKYSILRASADLKFNNWGYCKY